MVDVGFGGDGATQPLPMIHDPIITRNLGSQHVRLIYGPIPQFSDQDHNVWIYQYRNSDTAEWNSFYSFPEIEFLPHDYEIMNYYCSTHVEVGSLNFQTQNVLVIKFLRGVLEDGEGEVGIVGKIMLVDGVLKRNDGGKTSVVKICKTEVERIEVLNDLGISLSQEDVAAISGRNVELLGT